MTDPNAPPDTAPRLGEVGQIYVTLAAATRYSESRRMRIEEARRELTELLLGARCTREEVSGHPAHYRARSRTTQLDISATVVREGRLLVVLSIAVREHR